MEYYTFEQLKEMAFSDGITGNKVAVDATGIKISDYDYEKPAAVGTFME